jgi:hypothetical protein
MIKPDLPDKLKIGGKAETGNDKYHFKKRKCDVKGQQRKLQKALWQS